VNVVPFRRPETVISAKPRPEDFRIPGGTDRTVIIGGTGSGKTTFGAWLLSRQRFDLRAWVAIDFKGEELWGLVGSPPMRSLDLDTLPTSLGLFRLSVQPGEEDALERWLWRVWGRENIGLFADEVSLMQSNGFKAILRQGRSKRIPVIACSQRPVDCDREVFTEAGFRAVFRLDDERDYKIVRGLTRGADLSHPLPEHWCYWQDAARNVILVLKPVATPDAIAKRLREAIPVPRKLLGLNIWPTAPSSR
jgi:hypothetical protein